MLGEYDFEVSTVGATGAGITLIEDGDRVVLTETTSGTVSFIIMGG
jgi:predicted RNA-binding protein with TRAM domain